MSDNVRFERLLADVLTAAAPVHAPERLVPDILTAASRTRRRPRWLALAIERPMRRRAQVLVGAPTLRVAYLLLLALLVALLAVGTLVAGGIIPRPPDLAVTIPQPTPAATHADCMTDHVTLLPASSAPPISSDDEHVNLVSPDAAFGVYSGLYTGRLWVAGGGRTEPFNFGAIRDGQGIEVLDISPDRTRVLVRVLESSRSPDCGDLLEFNLNGAGSRRLTTFSTGRFVTGAAYAPEGDAVAYGVDLRDVGGQLVISPVSGDLVSFPCGNAFGLDAARIEWSPDAAYVATTCGRSARPPSGRLSGYDVTVFDASGRSTPVVGVEGEAIQSIRWLDAATLLVASGPWGENPGGFTIRALDPSGLAPANVIGEVDATIPAIGAYPTGMSPDGLYIYANGRPLTPTPGIESVGYLVSTSDGEARPLLEQGQEFLGWTDDGSAILYLDQPPEGGGAGPRDLVRLWAATGRVDLLGTWTTVCHCQGMWRAP